MINEHSGTVPNEFFALLSEEVAQVIRESHMEEEGMDDGGSDEEMHDQNEDHRDFMLATVVHAKTSAFLEMIDQIKR